MSRYVLTALGAALWAPEVLNAVLKWWSHFYFQRKFHSDWFSFLSPWSLGKILNASPSLFPPIKARNTHQQSLPTGFKVTGCAVHFVLVSVLFTNSDEKDFFFPPLSEGRSTNKWEECVEILGLLPVKHEVCRDYFARLYSLCLGRSFAGPAPSSHFPCLVSVFSPTYLWFLKVLPFSFILWTLLFSTFS